MSPDERKTESILLKERWNLTQSGVSKKDIKIRSSYIYVKQQLHGTVKNSVFQQITTSLGATNELQMNGSDDCSLSNQVDDVHPMATLSHVHTHAQTDDPTSRVTVTPQNDFTIGYWNARSLVNKLTFFNHLFTLKIMTFFSSQKLGFLILFMTMKYSPLGIPSIDLTEIIGVEELLFLLNLLFLLGFSMFLLILSAFPWKSFANLHLTFYVYIPPNHDASIVSSLDDFIGNLSPT